MYALWVIIKIYFLFYFNQVRDTSEGFALSIQLALAMLQDSWSVLVLVDDAIELSLTNR